VTGFVDLRDVRLSYGAGGGEEMLALDGLNMSVRKGEFAAVVGPSGCGKSTLMKLATGLIRPQGGTVEVAGKEVDGPVSVAGMAFQNPSMLPWRTTLKNVMLPLEIVQPHRRKLSREYAAYAEHAQGLLSMVGLAGFGEKFPWQLSGGMQQRANLCRALVHDPQLLMLDEPFGALDAFTREELWQVIRDLHAENRFTVVLVTHDLREAVFLADRVFVMSARPGKILAEREIGFERPRPIDLVYEAEFNDVVHELRGHIAEARAAA
jgi:NitT/TauT family transport system ATP-binding protein